MAAQVLFKSACPSCEALLPIRDEGMIGKKVECPKCKYKFVVEEPEGFGGDTGEAKPAKKAKKKSGSNAPLLIGAGVGAVAIAALAAVAFIVFGGDSASEQPKPSGVNVARTANTDVTTPAGDTPPAAAGENKAADAPATTAAAPVVTRQADPIPAAGASGDITNLLPNDSKMVVEVNMDKLRFCTFGDQMFESKVGFRPNAFKEKIGIGHENMLKLVRSENPEQKWSFNVLRLVNPINVKDLEKTLAMKKGAKSPINGREYWELGPNEILDNIGAALKPEAELAARKDRSAGPMAICQLDQSTLVFASIEPMEEFLKQNAKPKQLTKPSKSATEGDQSSPAAPTAPSRGRGMSQPMSERMMLAGGGTAMMQDADAPTSENATYLTIEAPLKAMMDRLPEDQKVKPIARAAYDMQADPRLFNRIRSLTGGLFRAPTGMRVFGITITHYELEKFYGMAGIEFFNENDVKELEATFKKLLPVQARVLALWLGGIKIETEGTDGAAASNTPTVPGAGGAPAGRGGPAPGGGGGAAGIPGLSQSDEGPTSKLKLSRKARYLFVDAELNLPQRAHDRIYSISEAIVAKMRGLADMASPMPMWKELSAALVKIQEGGEIPRATFQREENTGGKLARNWPPSHRVSWLVGLLPHLGLEDVHRQVERGKSWRDERNLKPGSLIIPPFLDPRFPEKTWYANLESLGSRVQGATHYVGMAGVGLEAGDYKADDPAVAKKLGAFGYDRVTAIKDVTDGVGNTIMMIEVAPNFQRPWIAGGGATVMGTPETRAIRPFIIKAQKGTHILMMDGSVRHIPENISDEVFKALCTIKGGETIDLEKVAPKAKANTAKMTTEPKTDKDKDKDDEKKDDSSDSKPDQDK